MTNVARRVTTGLLAGLALLAIAVSARADGPEAEPATVTPPRVSYVDGQVSFWRPGAEDWTPAPPNMAVAPGDEFHTGRPGNIELQIGARGFVRAWGDTQFGLGGQTPELLRFTVADGHVAVDLRALDSARSIQIDSPRGSFTIDRPGYYRVDVAPEAVSFTTRRAGHATLTRLATEGARTSAAPEPDAWDRWNQARTDELLTAASAQYVPDGVYGLHDLDHHGDWRVLPSYGAVWVPRGSPAGWAPYTTGRWFWDARFGWTWVDTAVWGWAPYHYGRWVFLDGVWAWAPGPIVARPVYAPALVAFFSAPGVRVKVGVPFVSWVALGWGEPVVPWWGRPGFVGRPAWHGWGGPRVVNNVVVQKTTVVHANDIRTYRNAGVHRAVVAVPPERFGRARVQDARVNEIDTRRLEPVRGPLRAVPETARRGEPAGRAPRTPSASPAPRLEPTPRPNVTAPGGGGERPQPRKESVPPRATAGDGGRDDKPPVAQPAPRRAQSPSPRVEPRPAEPRRTEPPSPRVESRRAEPVVPRMQPAPGHAERTPRPEPARPEWPARIESSRPRVPAGTPRPPEARPALDRPRQQSRDAAERVSPGGRERVEPRRAPASASPALRGAGARERPERNDARPRPGARG
jgi:hypothetical protein